MSVFLPSREKVLVHLAELDQQERDARERLLDPRCPRVFAQHLLRLIERIEEDRAAIKAAQSRAESD